MQTTEFDAVFDSPIGWLGLGLDDGAVSTLQFLPEQENSLDPSARDARAACAAVMRFLDNPGNTPALKLKPRGSTYQLRIWRALQDIVPGSVLTYGELAERTGSGARAVGNACRRNPVPLLIPCHRVIARSGLGGFAGQREGRLLDIKRWLLRHEGVAIRD